MSLLAVSAIFTLEQVADGLRVSKRTVKRLIEAGALEAVYLTLSRSRPRLGVTPEAIAMYQQRNRFIPCRLEKTPQRAGTTLRYADAVKRRAEVI